MRWQHSQLRARRKSLSGSDANPALFTLIITLHYHPWPLRLTTEYPPNLSLAAGTRRESASSAWYHSCASHLASLLETVQEHRSDCTVPLNHPTPSSARFRLPGPSSVLSSHPDRHHRCTTTRRPSPHQAQESPANVCLIAHRWPHPLRVKASTRPPRQPGPVPVDLLLNHAISTGTPSAIRR